LIHMERRLACKPLRAVAVIVALIRHESSQNMAQLSTSRGPRITAMARNK
jgi:hypothetical protein